MMHELMAARHSNERGMILRTLMEDYASLMTSVKALGRALDSMGISVSPESLDVHLMYLSQQGYLQIWRAGDMPQFRSDRTALRWVAPSAIMFARLTAKGMQLIDGDIPSDPKVAF